MDKNGAKDWSCISEKHNNKVKEHIETLSEDDRENFNYCVRNGK